MGLRSSIKILESHLLFADNTLIFREENPDHFCHLGCLFLCFEVVSRLRINLAKSKLVPVGVMDDTEGLDRILGCRVSTLSMKYLGLPLGQHRRLSLYGMIFLKKMERYLGGWKRLYLSKGGKLALIKITLSN